jgi:hypothetical protein
VNTGRAYIGSAAALALAWLLLWAVLNPYAGITHDGIGYALQALARLDPAVFAQDLFLRFQSQNDFTLFPWLHALFVEFLGLEQGTAALTLAFLVAWHVAAWFLARSVLSACMAWLAVGPLIAVPGDDLGRRRTAFRQVQRPAVDPVGAERTEPGTARHRRGRFGLVVRPKKGSSHDRLSDCHTDGSVVIRPAHSRNIMDRVTLVRTDCASFKGLASLDPSRRGGPLVERPARDMVRTAAPELSNSLQAGGLVFSPNLATEILSRADRIAPYMQAREALCRIGAASDEAPVLTLASLVAVCSRGGPDFVIATEDLGIAALHTGWPGHTDTVTFMNARL